MTTRLLPKEVEVLLTEIKKLKYKPKPKEARFLKAMEWNVAKYQRPSHRQSKWLEGIYQKASGGGNYESRNYV